MLSVTRSFPRCLFQTPTRGAVSPLTPPPPTTKKEQKTSETAQKSFNERPHLPSSPEGAKHPEGIWVGSPKKLVFASTVDLFANTTTEEEERIRETLEELTRSFF